MPAPEKSPRVLSPAGVEVRQDRVRTNTERVEGLFEELDGAFDRIGGLLAKAKAANADTTALEAELRQKEAERDRLETERAALADNYRELKGKRGRIAELEKKPLDELFSLYERRKASYPKEGTAAVNKAGEAFQKALQNYTEEGKGADLLGDMVVPYEPQTDRVRGIIASITGTGVDFKPLEAAIVEYDRLGEAYRNTPESDTEGKRKADRAAREAKANVKKAFSACKVALEEGLRLANVSGAVAGEPVSKTELKEELVWIEHVLAKKLKDPTIKETYIVKVATQEREAIINKTVVEKLSDQEKQKQFVQEVVKGLGVPLTTDELRALFERRKAAIRPAGGARRGGGAPAAPITYTEDRFGEEMADEVLYQINPNLITDNSADVRRRLQDRRVPIPPPFSKKLIELIGSAINDGSSDAPLMKLGGNLTSLVQPKPEVPGEARSFKDVERGLDQISEEVLTKLNDKVEAKAFLEAFKESEAARLGALDRTNAEAKVARLLDDAEKSLKLEQRATGMRSSLERAIVFVDKDLAELDKKLANDRKLWEEADAAHKRQTEVREQRAHELTTLEEGFARQSSSKQKKIETNNAAIAKIDADRLTDLIKEHEEKKGVLAEKSARLARLESMLGKIYDPGRNTFAFRDENVLSADAEILRDRDPKWMISSSVVHRASRAKAVTALEHLTAYKRALATDFFEKDLVTTYPPELTKKSPAYLRAEIPRIKVKCELIKEGKIAARVALDILNNGPVPSVVAPGPRPIPQPQKTLVHWTGPKPGFFDRLSPLRKAYDQWERDRAADEKINRDRATNDANALKDWQDKIAKANSEAKAWEDRLHALAKILREQCPNLPQLTIDTTKEDEELRQEVAAACVEALKPMLLESHLTGRRDQSTSILQAAKTAIEEVEQADTEKYTQVLKAIGNARGTLADIQTIKAELNTYVQARHAERMALKDEVDELKDIVEPLAQERERLERRRTTLAADVTTWTAEKAAIDADKATQVDAFNKQTPLLIDAADPAKAIEAWTNHHYDYTADQEELRKKTEGLVLELIKELVEWQAISASYPEERVPEESIAYLTARRDVKKSVERIKDFLGKRGDTVKDGLADVRALKTRLEQAFGREQRGRRENVSIRNEIYETFDHLKEPLKKDVGTV